jgi:hypothetical protein
LQPGDGAGQSALVVHILVQCGPRVGKSKQSPLSHCALVVQVDMNGKSPPSAPPLLEAEPELDPELGPELEAVEPEVEPDVLPELAAPPVPALPPAPASPHAHAPSWPSLAHVCHPCAPFPHVQLTRSPG